MERVICTGHPDGYSIPKELEDIYCIRGKTFWEWLLGKEVNEKILIRPAISIKSIKFPKLEDGNVKASFHNDKIPLSGMRFTEEVYRRTGKIDKDGRTIFQWNS